jgi:hypothetical protein
MGTRTWSRAFLSVAALALVALIGVVVFLPWSVASGCQPHVICEPQSAMNFGKIAAIVVLGAISFVTLILGLNPT